MVIFKEREWDLNRLIRILYVLGIIFFNAQSSVADSQTENTQDHVKKFQNLSIQSIKENNYEEGIELINKAITLDPNNAKSYRLKASFLRLKDDFDACMSNLQKAVTLKQIDYPAFSLLSWFYATSPSQKFRNGRLALEYAELVSKKDPNHPLYLRNLAAAHAENGNFQNAIQIQTKALNNLLSKKTTEEVIEKYRALLNSYQNHAPWREDKLGNIN